MEKIMNRRRMLRVVALGGTASALTACQLSPDMLNAGLGGAGGEANWIDLGREFEGAVALIAGQTDTLLDIQADYASVLDLKDEEAKLRAEAENWKSGDTFGASELRSADRATKNAERAISRKLGQIDALSNRQKQVLANGQERHDQSIQRMWVGVIRVGKVLIDARSAQRPSFRDVELIDVFRNITRTAPRAIAFGETSRDTYTSYNEAFAAKGVYTPPRERVSGLSLDSV
jgi:hypothetical protein